MGLKKLIETTENELETLLGERVTMFCTNYIYTGKLAGVNGTYVQLTDASLV
jgi:hypothetical protein